MSVRSPLDDRHDHAACRPVRSVAVLPDDVRLPARPDETIEQAIYRSGFAHRRGCRRGGCGVCAADLLAGEVTYDHPIAPGVISAADRAAGAILVCRAVPTTDVVIRLRNERLRTVSPLLRQLAARELGDTSTEGR